MLEKALGIIFEKILSRFIAIKTSDFRVSLWTGEVLLEKVQLKLPYGKGIIEKLKITIPWRSLWSSSVIIIAQDVSIISHVNSDISVESLSVDPSRNDNNTEETDKSYLSKLLTCIVMNIKLDIVNVKIRYDCSADMSLNDQGICSGAIDISNISYRNINDEDKSVFTNMSTTSVTSTKKKLLIEKTSLYVENRLYYTSEPDRKEPNRIYSIKDWGVSLLGNLSYNDSTSQIPNMDIRITIFHASSELLLDKNLKENKFDAESSVILSYYHLLTFVSILNDIRLPYKIYEGFVSEETKVAVKHESRIKKEPFFVSVLTYCKNWLLVDDPIIISNLIGVNTNDPNDDEDFYDTVSPPTLAITLGFVKRLTITLKDDQLAWIVNLRNPTYLIKQSCMDTEINFTIDDFSLEEKKSGDIKGIVQKKIVEEHEKKRIIEIICVIPFEAKESTSVSFRMKQKDLSISLSNCNRILRIFQPLSLWKIYKEKNNTSGVIKAAPSIPSLDINVQSISLRLCDAKNPHSLVFAVSEIIASRPSDNVIVVQVSSFSIFSANSSYKTQLTKIERIDFVISASTSKTNTTKIDAAHADIEDIKKNIDSTLIWVTEDFDNDDENDGTNDNYIPAYGIKMILPNSINLDVAEEHIVLISFFIGVISELGSMAPNIKTDKMDDTNKKSKKIDFITSWFSLNIRTFSKNIFQFSIGIANTRLKCLCQNQNVNCALDFENVSLKTENEKEDSLFYVYMGGSKKNSISYYQGKKRLAYVLSLQKLILRFHPTKCKKLLSIFDFFTTQERLQDSYKHNISNTHKFLQNLHYRVFLNLSGGAETQLFEASGRMMALLSVSRLDTIIDSTINSNNINVFSMHGSIRNINLYDKSLPSIYSTLPSHNVFTCFDEGKLNSIYYSLTNQVNSCFKCEVYRNISLRADDFKFLYSHRFYKEIIVYISEQIFPVLSLFNLHEKKKTENKRNGVLHSKDDQNNLIFEVVLSNGCVLLPQSTVSKELLKFDFSYGKFWYCTDVDRNKNEQYFFSRAYEIELSKFLKSGLLDNSNFQSFHGTGDVIDWSQPKRSWNLGKFTKYNRRIEQDKKNEARQLKIAIQQHKTYLLRNQIELNKEVENVKQHKEHCLHNNKNEKLGFYDKAENVLESKLTLLRSLINELNNHLDYLEKEVHDDNIAFDHDSSIKDDILTNENERKKRFNEIRKLKQSLLSNASNFRLPNLDEDEAKFYDTNNDKEEKNLKCEDNQGGFIFELDDIRVSNEVSVFLTKKTFLNGLLIIPTFETQTYPNERKIADDSILLKLFFGDLNVHLTSNTYNLVSKVIWENFAETSVIMNYELAQRCTSCQGHHYNYQKCNMKWFHVSVHVLDVSIDLYNHNLNDLVQFTAQKFYFHLSCDTCDTIEILVKANELRGLDTSTKNISNNVFFFPNLMDDSPSKRHISYKQNFSWTGQKLFFEINSSSFILFQDIYVQVIAFFIKIFYDTADYINNYTKETETNPFLFNCSNDPIPYNYEIKIDIMHSSLSLLEKFNGSTCTRSLVVFSDISYRHEWSNINNIDVPTTEIQLSLVQKTIFFTTIYSSQMEGTIPVCNVFTMAADYIESPIEVNSSSTLKKRQRRFSIALHPVEVRFSVQDYILFMKIVDNYTQNSLTTNIPERQDSNNMLDEGEYDVKETIDINRSSMDYSENLIIPKKFTYADHDMLMGQFGNIRFILVNNSLGIPVADLQISDISLECQSNIEDQLTCYFGTLVQANYFNNRIYRWEPSLEPFNIKITCFYRNYPEKFVPIDNVKKSYDEEICISVIIPSTLNINITNAMAYLISVEALRYTDIVTTGATSTAPYWIKNNTGSDLVFSFRRGNGSIIHQSLSSNERKPLNCRVERNVTTTYDKMSLDVLAESSLEKLTASHSLSLWLNEGKWRSRSPVIVDVVGSIAISLQYSNDTLDDKRHCATKDDGSTIPPLIADIKLQEDGSKIIDLHSQILLKNHTNVPLSFWIYSPNEGGMAREIIASKGGVSYFPLTFVHPESKLSIRPSTSVSHGPVINDFEFLHNDYLFLNKEKLRSKKNKEASLHIQGICTCGHMQQPQPSSLSRVDITTDFTMLSGMVETDLPCWQCHYDIRGFKLSKAIESIPDNSNIDDNDQDISSSETRDEGNQRLDDIFSFRMTLKETEAKSKEDITSDTNNMIKKSSMLKVKGYCITLSPLLTLHNHLANPLAYRLLNKSMQLMAEGVLPIGQSYPFFQFGTDENIYFCFCIQNYEWSSPSIIRSSLKDNKKKNLISHKLKIVNIILKGMRFKKKSNISCNMNMQGMVPDLEIKMKQSDKNIHIFSPLWLVNHSGLDLVYSSSSPSQLNVAEMSDNNDIKTYFHANPCSDIKASKIMKRKNKLIKSHDATYPVDNQYDLEISSPRETSPDKIEKDAAMIPIALFVIVEEAKELVNVQVFGTQSPFVRVSLCIPSGYKNRVSSVGTSHNNLSNLEILMSTETKPATNGGMNPRWHNPNNHQNLNNSLYLVFPSLDKKNKPINLKEIIVLFEVINVFCHLETIIGSTCISLVHILKNREKLTLKHWYQLRRPKLYTSESTDESSKENRCGKLGLSLTVGYQQNLSYSFEGRLPVGTILTSEHEDNMDRKFEVTLKKNEDSLVTDPYMLQVYLPFNRFQYIIVPINTNVKNKNSLLTFNDIFQIIIKKVGALDEHSLKDETNEMNRLDCFYPFEDYYFYEIILPRFVSLRSPGRQESDRWYSKKKINNEDGSNRILNFGFKYGLYLCHKITDQTLRIHFCNSNASPIRHSNSDSLNDNRQPNMPAPWGEAIMFGSGGRSWDTLRVKAIDSLWSDLVHLRKNVIGRGSGVAQVLNLEKYLVNETDYSDKQKLTTLSRYEIALWTNYGVGAFSDTIITTIVPRYVIINRITDEKLIFRQVGTDYEQSIALNELTSYHWYKSDTRKMIQITFSSNNNIYSSQKNTSAWSWSGEFSIDVVGTTYIKIRRSSSNTKLNAVYIVQLQIELSGGSMIIVFHPEMKRWPPYRIDNQTSFDIRYKQSNWNSPESLFDELPSRCSVAYCWDRHTTSNSSNNTISNSSSSNFQNAAAQIIGNNRLLTVIFMQQNKTINQKTDDSQVSGEKKEYNLDEMLTYKSFRLQRSLPYFSSHNSLQGYLLKRDNFLKKKWNLRYFRLHENILYYFPTKNDWELRGIIDLTPGVAQDGQVSISMSSFEHKTNALTDNNSPSLVDQVANAAKNFTNFGRFKNSDVHLSSKKDNETFFFDINESSNEKKIDRTEYLLSLASKMSKASKLLNKIDRKETNNNVSVSEFVLPGYLYVDFLLDENFVPSRNQATYICQEMVTCGILVFRNNGNKKNDKTEAEQENEKGKDLINVKWKIFLDSNEFFYALLPLNVETSSSDHNRGIIDSSNKTNHGPFQFTIASNGKSYDLRANSSEEMIQWVSVLRSAAGVNRYSSLNASTNGSNSPERNPSNNSLMNSSSKRSVNSFVQSSGELSTKTFIQARVRADGPTKVLELTEIGLNDDDDGNHLGNLIDITDSNNRFNKNDRAKLNENLISNTLVSSDLKRCGIKTISTTFLIHSLGVSCINDTPIELLYIYFSNLQGIVAMNNNNRHSFSLTIDTIQIDNQVPDATFCTLLHPRRTKFCNLGSINKAKTNNEIYSIKNEYDTINEERKDENASDSSSLSPSQIMNELSPEPAVDNEDKSETDILFFCEDCNGATVSNQASFHFCCGWLNESGKKTAYFDHSSFWICPMTIQLDEDLFKLIKSFFGKFIVEHRNGNNNDVTIQQEEAFVQISIQDNMNDFFSCFSGDELDPLDIDNTSYNVASSSSEGSKIYFALFHIHPIELNVTFHNNIFNNNKMNDDNIANNLNTIVNDTNNQSNEKTIHIHGSKKEDASFSTAALTSWMHIPDLDNAPIKFSTLIIEHVFGTGNEVTKRITKYYTRQLWRQLHKVFGSFDFLGNPVGLLDHIGTGVRDFIYEPLEGLKAGGKGFREGIAKGTSSLLTNTVDGTFDAASKLSGTLSQGLATISLDEHYQYTRAKARRKTIHSIREGVTQGVKELGIGFYEGFSGIVLAPYRGVKENGAIGLIKGTAAGIIGIPIKPVAGIFDFASRTAQGIRNRSDNDKYQLDNNGEIIQRIRPPRVFGRYKQLHIYKEEDTYACYLLGRSTNDYLRNEQILYYYEIIQTFYTDEIIQEVKKVNINQNKGLIKKKSSSTFETKKENRSLFHDFLLKDYEKDSKIPERIYEICFYNTELGLNLETDFYCQDVIVKEFHDGHSNKYRLINQIHIDQTDNYHSNSATDILIEQGDVIRAIGGISVEGIPFKDTMELLRKSIRPVNIIFSSGNRKRKIYSVNTINKLILKNHLSMEKSDFTTNNYTYKSDTKVEWNHWLIVTEERIIYINANNFNYPTIEWTTPLKYIIDVKTDDKSNEIIIYLGVGIDSLPLGPAIKPDVKKYFCSTNEREMEKFCYIMQKSFYMNTMSENNLADEQELWPNIENDEKFIITPQLNTINNHKRNNNFDTTNYLNDTSCCGYLGKKGYYRDSYRFFLLYRNCLYYYDQQDPMKRNLLGVIPLGNVQVERVITNELSLRILPTNCFNHDILKENVLNMIYMDKNKIIEKKIKDMILYANDTDTFNMWYSAINHASGKGLRKSFGKRFYGSSDKNIFKIGCKDIPDHIISSIIIALKRTVEAFS